MQMGYLLRANRDGGAREMPPDWVIGIRTTHVLRFDVCHCIFLACPGKIAYLQDSLSWVDVLPIYENQRLRSQHSAVQRVIPAQAGIQGFGRVAPLTGQSGY